MSRGPLPVWAGLLSAQGKCLFDFLVWDDGDDVLLDCEAAAADDLVKRLSMYRLRRAIVIARDETLAVHWSPEAGRAFPIPGWPRLDIGGWLALDATLRPAPEHGWLAHRLRLGVCEGRAELGDLLWLECNADELNGVSFTKGCFVGQENTARMNWRSKVNRRLFVVPSGVAPRSARAGRLSRAWAGGGASARRRGARRGDPAGVDDARRLGRAMFNLAPRDGHRGDDAGAEQAGLRARRSRSG